MSSETAEQTPAVPASPAGGKREWKYAIGEHHIHREDLRKVWKECQEESLWYRALPLSLGSMALTGGLIYNGVWKSSKRFGPFPKLAVAGILGFFVGRASYAPKCRSKFKKLGLEDGFGPWAGGHPFGPKSDRGHRCHHVCEECKKKSQTAPAEEVKS